MALNSTSENFGKFLIEEGKRSLRAERSSTLASWNEIVKGVMATEIPDCDKVVIAPRDSQQGWTGILITYNDVNQTPRAETWMMTELEMQKADGLSLPPEELPYHLRLARIAIKYIKDKRGDKRLAKGTKAVACVGFATKWIDGKHQLKANSCSNMLANEGGDRTLTKLQVQRLLHILKTAGLDIGINIDGFKHFMFEDVRSTLQVTSPLDPILQDFRWSKGAATFLAKGGFGKLFQYDCSDGRRFAVKVIDLGDGEPQPNGFCKDFSEESQHELKRELEFVRFYMQNTVSHKGIVDHYGAIAGQKADNDCIFIFMELCHECLNTNDTKGNEHTCKQYAYQLTSALAFLHSWNVAHRDVKVDNILLCKKGVEVTLKLGDFGSSKTNARSSSNANTNASTFWYEAPELVLGRHAGKKVDVWGIGCTFVQMWAGEWPWKLLPAHVHHARVLNHEVLPLDIPGKDSVNDFIGICFLRNPQERPSCAMLLQHEMLREFVEKDAALQIQSFVRGRQGRVLADKVKQQNEAKKDPAIEFLKAVKGGTLEHASAAGTKEEVEADVSWILHSWRILAWLLNS